MCLGSTAVISIYIDRKCGILTLKSSRIMYMPKNIIEAAFENSTALTPQNAPAKLKEAINEAMALLDSGKARVAEKIQGTWQTHQWLKKAVLLYFRLYDNQLMQSGCMQYFDKVPLKFSQATEAELKIAGVRIVPPAVARRGRFIAPNTILMPSYINIGAYI